MQRVISFIGPRNSGKTTTVSELTRLLAGKSISVAVLKHIERGGLEYNRNKDSAKHFEHGAQLSIASDDETASVLVHLKDDDDPGSLIDRFLFDLDIVLVEGYSKSNMPKAVFLTGNADEDKRFRGVKNIACFIISPDSPLTQKSKNARSAGEIMVPIIDEIMDSESDLAPTFFFSDEIEDLGEFILSSPLLCYKPDKAILYVNGRKIYIKDFVQDFIKGAVAGMISSLRGTRDARFIELKIRN